MTEETARIDAEMKKALQQELEHRRNQLKEEKERQSKLPEWDLEKKEPFDAKRVIIGLYHPTDEKVLHKFLDNKQQVESLEMDYYLGFYEQSFKTNMEYVNFLNTED